jgi:uncharacterized 2Fe-2S/4Fe-4S cluster protein (DUF4445 family)
MLSISELRKTGIIDKRGAFNAENERLRIENGRAKFVLVPAEKSGLGREISIERTDINEIQLAKAAIRSGAEMLIKTAGIQNDDIEQFLVGGHLAPTWTSAMPFVLACFHLYRWRNSNRLGMRQVLGQDKC